jgi:hypothetical protein
MKPSKRIEELHGREKNRINYPTSSVLRQISDLEFIEFLYLRIIAVIKYLDEEYEKGQHTTSAAETETTDRV